MNRDYVNIVLFLVLGFPMKEQPEGVQVVSLSSNKKLQLTYYRLTYQHAFKKPILSV